MKNLKRKEVILDEATLVLLQRQAELDGRKLKNYMEFVLTQKANEFQLSDEYKNMMDELLEQHYSGKAKYHKWEDVKADLLTKK